MPPLIYQFKVHACTCICTCMYVFMYVCFLMIVGNEEVTAAHTGKFCGLAFSFPSCKEAACNTFCVNKHINVSGAVRGLCEKQACLCIWGC